MRVNPPGDAFEQEVDAVTQAMTSLENIPDEQRQEIPEEEEIQTQVEEAEEEVVMMREEDDPQVKREPAARQQQEQMSPSTWFSDKSLILQGQQKPR
jgi:hypothetical protein